MSNKTEGIATLAQDMLVLKRSNTLTGTRPQADMPKLESEIDQLVYQLYGLTKEEIDIVEGVK